MKHKFIESQDELDKVARLDRDIKSIKIALEKLNQTIENISLTELQTKKVNFKLLTAHSQNLKDKTRTDKETKIFLIMVFSIFGIINLGFWGCSQLAQHPSQNNLPQVSTR